MLFMSLFLEYNNQRAASLYCVSQNLIVCWFHLGELGQPCWTIHRYYSTGGQCEWCPLQLCSAQIRWPYILVLDRMQWIYYWLESSVTQELVNYLPVGLFPSGRLWALGKQGPGDSGPDLSSIALNIRLCKKEYLQMVFVRE